jgi:hypothetical protein
MDKKNNAIYTIEEKRELTRLMCEDMILREKDDAAVCNYVNRIEDVWRTKTAK